MFIAAVAIQRRVSPTSRCSFGTALVQTQSRGRRVSASRAHAVRLRAALRLHRGHMRIGEIVMRHVSLALALAPLTGATLVRAALPLGAARP